MIEIRFISAMHGELFALVFGSFFWCKRDRCAHPRHHEGGAKFPWRSWVKIEDVGNEIRLCSKVSSIWRKGRASNRLPSLLLKEVVVYSQKPR